MRILVLDDDFIRQAAFLRFYPNDTLVFAQRYWDFCDELEEWEDQFDLIHLDHDLGDPSSGADAYENGFEVIVPYDGRDAVDHLALLIKKPKRVLIHTMNPVIGTRMAKDLCRAGFDAATLSFGEMI